jgi:hypothetical protein
MLTVVTVVSYLAVAAFVAALVCSGVRRWRFAARLSSAAWLASLAILILLLGRFVAAYLGATDAASKAAVLTLSLSELMNGSVIPFLVAIAGAVVWDLARRRVLPS